MTGGEFDSYREIIRIVGRVKRSYQIIQIVLLNQKLIELWSKFRKVESTSIDGVGPNRIPTLSNKWTLVLLKH